MIFCKQVKFHESGKLIVIFWVGVAKHAWACPKCAEITNIQQLGNGLRCCCFEFLHVNKVPSVSQSVTHSLTHSLTRSLTHSLTHSLNKGISCAVVHSCFTCFHYFLLDLLRMKVHSYYLYPWSNVILRNIFFGKFWAKCSKNGQI